MMQRDEGEFVLQCRVIVLRESAYGRTLEEYECDMLWSGGDVCPQGRVTSDPEKARRYRTMADAFRAIKAIKAIEQRGKPTWLIAIDARTWDDVTVGASERGRESRERGREQQVSP